MNDVMGKRIDEIVDRIVKSCITDLLYESQGILHQSMQDLGKEITSKLMAQPNCDNFYINIDDNHYNIPFDKIFIVIVNGFGRGFRGTNFASGYLFPNLFKNSCSNSSYCNIPTFLPFFRVLY